MCPCCRSSIRAKTRRKQSGRPRSIANGSLRCLTPVTARAARASGCGSWSRWDRRTATSGWATARSLSELRSSRCSPIGSMWCTSSSPPWQGTQRRAASAVAADRSCVSTSATSNRDRDARRAGGGPLSGVQRSSGAGAARRAARVGHLDGCSAPRSRSRKCCSRTAGDAPPWCQGSSEFSPVAAVRAATRRHPFSPSTTPEHRRCGFFLHDVLATRRAVPAPAANRRSQTSGRHLARRGAHVEVTGVVTT
jgi:hypothetical protein